MKDVGADSDKRIVFGEPRVSMKQQNGEEKKESDKSKEKPQDSTPKEVPKEEDVLDLGSVKAARACVKRVPSNNGGCREMGNSC